MKKWIFCLLWSVNLANGAGFLYNYSSNDVSITAGFIPDSSKIIVGEPLFLTFVLSNRAEHIFQFCRVNTEIFSFAATNETGLPAKKLFLHAMDGNGFVSNVKIDPGKAFTCRLFLNGWYEFDTPGNYTVTCRCKFDRCFTQTNSFDSFEQPIVTVFKLRVLPSNPARITEIIDEWSKVIETNGPLDEAAQALAEFNDARIIPPLAALVKRDANNYFAVNALAQFTNDAAADALAVVLKSGEDYMADFARAAIGKSHQSDRIALSFLSGLTNTEVNIRIQNARALGWSGSEQAFTPLCTLLGDKTNVVRYAAAEAIGRLNDARSFTVLTNCLNDSDFALRIAAVKGLLASGRPIQSEWLTPVIRAANHHYDKFQTYMDAIDLIHLYGGDQAAAELVSCLDFSNPSINDWYNFYLLQYIGAHWKPPYYHYYKWHEDLNRDGTPQELTDNRQILAELKAWLEQHEPK